MNKPEDFKIPFTNEKGNVMVAARNKLRKSSIRKLHKLTAEFNDCKVITNDGIALPLGVDAATGETIWAHMSITVSCKEPQPATDKDVAALAKELF